ncbi:hypothetical protein E2C01_095135 [Portunus trituberculatus]|uniref:Uncharacterized protein n=1 Tax=Portunus trituberculatus TaxID=210409 RepID=A0A5B7JYQ9_PORTR|nr:hypothetical protein [Portunus trituberculatus]
MVQDGWWRTLPRQGTGPSSEAEPSKLFLAPLARGPWMWVMRPTPSTTRRRAQAQPQKSLSRLAATSHVFAAVLLDPRLRHAVPRYLRVLAPRLVVSATSKKRRAKRFPSSVEGREALQVTAPS